MTVTANIHRAKTTLSQLIERALAGEDVVIAKAGKPVVRLTPVGEAAAIDRAAIFGSMRGKMRLAPDWEQSPFDDEMHREWYGDDAEPRLHAAQAAKHFRHR